MSDFRVELEQVELELSIEKQRGALQDSVKVETLEARRAELLEELNAATKEVVIQKQEESGGGLKETLYQIFDIVFPADTNAVLHGINEFNELAKTFRQLVNAAVNESNEQINEFIGQTLEDKDSRIISLTSELRESIRKEQASVTNYERMATENESLEQEVVSLQNELAEKESKLNSLQETVQAKDEQIAKLTEQRSASTIYVPEHKTSQSLAQMMEDAKKKIPTSKELALSGTSYRGKVEITPPTLGGSEVHESFRDEASEAVVIGGGIYTPEVPSLEKTFPEAPEHGVDEEHPAVEVAGETTTLAQRVAELEKAVFGKVRGEAA